MATTTSTQGTHQWTVDGTHSSVDFSVKHLGVFTVRGTLGQITGSGVTTDSKLTQAALLIQSDSINTNNEQRDAHVKGADFLNVEAYPTITFASTSIIAKSDTEYSITGDLTISGQTHTITVEGEAVAPVTDPWGNTRSGFTGTGQLKRSDFGITYNSVMETGHLMISDEIKFTFDIQAIVVAG